MFLCFYYILYSFPRCHLLFFIFGSSIFECLVASGLIFLEKRRVMQIFPVSVLKLRNEWEVVQQFYLASSYKLSSSTLASVESTQLNPGSESLFGLILVSRLGGNCFTGYPLRQPRRFRLRVIMLCKKVYLDAWNVFNLLLIF